MPLNFHAPKFWFSKNIISYLLLPFALLYRIVVAVRRFFYLRIFKAQRLLVPIIVVGNITVGGSGKTPLVIWIAEFLTQHGFTPGIISRGYGGKFKAPHLVTAASKVEEVGDEALLLAKRTMCPVMISAKRVAAVQQLIKTTACNIIISDDGLQHYALARDIQIVVMDNERKIGNGFCLPAGPLREPISVLREVDFVINGYGFVEEHKTFTMQFEPTKVYNLNDSKKIKYISAFRGLKIHAVAGIGNPEKFFQLLNTYGLEVIAHAFPDHYVYREQDLAFADHELVITTEKDAVRMQGLVHDNFWCLAIDAKLDDEFAEKLLQAVVATGL